MSDVVIDGLVGCGVPEIITSVRARVIMLVHLPLGDESPDAADLVPLERRALHASDVVVVTSAQARERVIALHSLPPAKVHVASPGVDPAPLAEPSAGGGRLLCVASINRRKGQDVLLSALARLSDLDWRCTVAGAGSLSDLALDPAARTLLPPPDPDVILDSASGPHHLPHPGAGRAENYGVGTTISGDRPQGRIRELGPLAPGELAAAYADADLLVLPSRAETYGMVVTEALARGIPVISTQVAGVPEALGDPPAGTLVPPGDPDALAQALRTWLTDPSLRDRWRTAARHRRETLRGWDETTRLLMEVLR